MRKTVVSHFYNEEHLLPWWLNHHKQIFDHGILIDYHSTDRSMEIIREICPDWELRYTRNRYFDSDVIDQEVMDIEKGLEGWRMCLNTTEFLYGNVSYLDDRTEPTQYLIGNYVFVDMEDETKGPLTLSHDVPLHKQRYWGYQDISGSGMRLGAGSMARMNRSLHNYPVTYTGGRHWPGTPKSFEDLVIFYYGYADISDPGLKRKTQIQTKISAAGHHHSYDKEGFLRQYRNDQRPQAHDLSSVVTSIYETQQKSLENKNNVIEVTQPSIESDTEELTVTYEGTVVKESKLIQAEPRTVG